MVFTRYVHAKVLLDFNFNQTAQSQTLRNENFLR